MTKQLKDVPRYTEWIKQRVPLFCYNFGKCRLIFITLSSLNSEMNRLFNCTIFRSYHQNNLLNVTASMPHHQDINASNQHNFVWIKSHNVLSRSFCELIMVCVYITHSNVTVCKWNVSRGYCTPVFHWILTGHNTKQIWSDISHYIKKCMSLSWNIDSSQCLVSTSSLSAAYITGCSAQHQTTQKIGYMNKDWIYSGRHSLLLKDFVPLWLE